jgi:hypothetical protein
MLDAERDLLVRGIAAAKAGGKDEARFFLEKFLRLEPAMEMRTEAWRYLAEISDSSSEKRDYIGRILAVDPADGDARRELALLDGRLDPADIVNPDRVPQPAPSATAMMTGERLSCPRCGSGRLVAGADGKTLVCQHCRYEEPIVQRGHDAVHDRDFTATMWTAKGHRTAERTVAFACGGCGASFLLPPGIQSCTCPFCGSVHVNPDAESREFITPAAMLPFGHAAPDVLETLRSEISQEPASGPLPVYIPVWMFTFVGTVRWTGDEHDQERFGSQPEKISGDYAVIDQVALVCGTARLPEPLQHLVDTFDLSALRACDPRQLAGYPVATYQLTLDEASVVGRRKALKALDAAVREELGDIPHLEMTFARVGVDTFMLLLLPFWIAQYGPPDERRLVFVNGQTRTIGQNAQEPGLIARIARWAGLSREPEA